MDSNLNENEYVKPEERIYQVATSKDYLDWKNFLYQLIHDEGLDPWNVDLGILTQKYLEALREVTKVDFDVSGKFLTIAVFLLKTKAENLLEKDLRGIEEKIAWAQDIGVENFDEGLDGLEAIDNHLDEVEIAKKKEKYSIKVRNPIARKRKVNIFDLIKLLEKTFEQSNKRKSNFLLKNKDSTYVGPVYEKKSKDLNVLISELHQIILDELGNKKAHIYFSHITRDVNHKQGVLERFIPLLHLHNHNKVYLKQEKHLSDIEIHKVNE